MITSNWNYNLTELNEYIEQLLQAAETIQNFDEKTNKVSYCCHLLDFLVEFTFN